MVEFKADLFLINDVCAGYYSGNLYNYIYAIASSNLPSKEMFEFLIKYKLIGSKLYGLIVDWYQKDLNLFTEAVIKFKRDGFRDTNDCYTTLATYSLKYQESLGTQKDNEVKKKELMNKSVDELADELLGLI